eukprot:4151343-Amphidinium_carterae.1
MLPLVSLQLELVRKWWFVPPLHTSLWLVPGRWNKRLIATTSRQLNDTSFRCCKWHCIEWPCTTWSLLSVPHSRGGSGLEDLCEPNDWGENLSGGTLGGGARPSAHMSTRGSISGAGDLTSLHTPQSSGWAYALRAHVTRVVRDIVERVEYLPHEWRMFSCRLEERSSSNVSAWSCKCIMSTWFSSMSIVSVPIVAMRAGSGLRGLSVAEVLQYLPDDLRNDREVPLVPCAHEHTLPTNVT